MTIQYKPKTVVIDTNEYKLKPEQKEQVSRSHAKDTSEHGPNPFE